MLRNGLVILAGLAAMAPAAAAQTVEAGATSRAAAAKPWVGFVAEAALEFGGDAFATVNFDDGSTQDVRTGQGLTVSVGGQLRPSVDSPLGLRGTVGFKFVGTAADNANIFLTRLPVEVVGTYRLPQDAWVGAGFVHHALTKFWGGGLGPDVDFTGGNGATVEAGWRWLGVSYTSMRYTDDTDAEYDASVFGIFFTSAFSR